MSYQGKSTDVWHKIGGILGAYQFIGAPNQQSAYQNIGRGVLGRNTLSVGVAPTWSHQLGMIFNGSTQYLDTGITPSTYLSTILVRFSGGATGGVCVVAGCWQPPAGPFYNFTPSTGSGHYHAFESAWGTSPDLASGIMGYEGANCYLNGVLEHTLPVPILTPPACGIYLGARNRLAVGAELFFSGNVQCALIVERRLATGEYLMVSRQMADCEKEPAWNAWGRQRRYYDFSIPTATMQAAWAAYSNAQIGVN